MSNTLRLKSEFIATLQRQAAKAKPSTATGATYCLDLCPEAPDCSIQKRTHHHPNPQSQPIMNMNYRPCGSLVLTANFSTRRWDLSAAFKHWRHAASRIFKYFFGAANLRF
ncbi:hypothetical protein AVEN_1415-1 [Araneus ventricosus]|uniref:Uncharacterized protein n=1 Tax=Araneus ventricosus TaxID=182803 RepID=A0A4Y2SVB3_ARAVE|nr:hypothetical protein AVEN_1415-1 [Araneus ventricosus]